jgi:hypothetical protein
VGVPTLVIQMVPGSPGQPSFCFVKGHPAFVLRACAFCIQMTPGLLGHPSSLLSTVTLILYRGCTWRTWVLQISAGICIEATAHCIRNNTRDCGSPPPFGLERLPQIFMEEHLEHPPSVHSGRPLFVFKMVPGLPSHPPSFCFVKATQEIRIAGVRVLYANNARDSGSPSFSFGKVGSILYGAAPGTPAIGPSWCPLFIFNGTRVSASPSCAFGTGLQSPKIL